jgi:hypothetical protein
MATTATSNPSMEALLVAARALAQCGHDQAHMDEEGYFCTCSSCGATTGDVSAWHAGRPAVWEPTDLVAAVIAALPPGQ